MNDPYLISMNKEISDNKMKSIGNYLKFLIYFGNFYLYHNFPFILTSIIIVYFIKGNGIRKTFTFFAAGFSSWFFHWLSHKVKFLNVISGHRFHHQEKTNLFEDTHEFMSDVFAAGFGFLVLNYFLKKIGIHLFNDYVLVYFMFAFPLVHLFIYHKILKKSYHQIHHDNTKKNFSPDFFDHIFNENLDHNIEDTSHMVPIFIVVGLLVIYIQRKKLLVF